MSSSLNVIALISGGKDSLYSVLHCIQTGHNVVALANLHPTQIAPSGDNVSEEPNIVETEGEDINSFMYQTVGYSIIPLYASALNLPLYRRAISGTATQTGRYYAFASDGSQDETEDLMPLLKEVMQNHPNANAICSGAILSTYQRTRIESIALRLGITPLSFLWQYPALPPPVEREDSITGLLDDMEAAGCDARIIKIASGGVKESMLWADVTSPETRNQLVNAMTVFFEDHEFWLRGAVLGEGGEYETLAINGPSRVWKKRIEVQEDGNVVVQGEGGASTLRFGQARTVDQNEVESDHTTETNLVRTPVLLDHAFAILESQIASDTVSPDTATRDQTEQGESGGFSPPRSTEGVYPNVPYLQTSVHVTPTTITISNITTTECSGAAQKTQHLMKLLGTCIHSTNLEHHPTITLSEDDIVFTTLLLDDMSDFATVNSEYSKAFTAPNPPARITVACGGRLPGNVQVSLSVVLDTKPRERRRGLHVQSRSYWAPANIGPYSQAISVPLDHEADKQSGDDVKIVHVAGQIPLIPHTMELLNSSYLQQTILSLQHLWRIGQEREVDWWTHGIAYLAKHVKSTDNQLDRVRCAWEVWRRANAASQKPPDATDDEDDEEGPDAWDLRHNPYHHRNLHSSAVPSPRKPSGTHVHQLPNPSLLQNRTSTSATDKTCTIPPLIVAEVQSLPRSAPIEWHSLGLGHLPSTTRRLRIGMTRHEWGCISHCTMLACTTTQNDVDDMSDEGDGAEMSQTRTRKSTTTEFITIQIYNQHDEPGAGSFGNIPSTTSLIDDISAAGSDGTSSTNPWSIVQGSAYVTSNLGWNVLQGLQQTSGWDALTIVPCHAVWGCTAEHGVEELLKRLILGIVARRESADGPS